MKYGFFPGCTYSSSAGYKESTEAVSKILGTELIEIEDWNCCGATSYWSTQDIPAYVLPARIMALAEKQNLKQIVNVCNACYSTLRKAKEKLSKDNELLEKVNISLAEEKLKYSGKVTIRHYLEVIVNDLKPEDIKKHVNVDIKDVIVAPYYGCQLNRPWGDLDNPHYPTMLDRLCKIIGAGVLSDFSAKTSCCGAASIMPHNKECLSLNQRIVSDALFKGAKVISTICPLCQLNVDASQLKLNLTKIPVLYFTQLMGLAFGLNERELGMDKLIVPFKI
ncbi:MAG: CoB--CoM heterodisulfide reductase iron-sulfur subunit B family protein [Candidatus Magnetomorum sp.]|nr:CoB--CoM heterodisulfide reductase iron-sulfur subunit B family protein [Candidatus Magnetomorum sp.]